MRCFDAVGRAKTVAESIDSVRKGGTVTLIGNIEPEVDLPLQKGGVAADTDPGNRGVGGGYPEAIELIIEWADSGASVDHRGCAARRGATVV